MPDPTPPTARPDASSPFTDPLLPPGELSLPNLCKRINERITTFLAKDAETEALRSVQKHTRIALGVIEEALNKYRYTIVQTAFKSYTKTKISQFNLIITLLQRRQRLPSPPNPLPLRPPQPFTPPHNPPPIRLHRLLAPLSRSRRFRKHILSNMFSPTITLQHGHETSIHCIPART